ncbi:hypothetical protein K505DRAFT_367872 [Melanomma pulvis-pyrius CBS 109.77]|uniref:Uncharacterized protein n=1 Tax=Melanomma pulvis-pyrius CBS 109.77 TaxID=1314802 RepID=A0A6A6WSG0_9PLEO|nr:hypothetical protein K505DRAFT_367872 [Melanomma pulvis-pyrius CBS 109.77]
MSQNLNTSRIVLAIQSTLAGIRNQRCGTVQVSAASKELLNAIKRSVNAAMRNTDDNQPDWRAQVLEPTTNDFPDAKNLTIGGQNGEHVLFISCVVLLGYEIIRQRGPSLSDIDDEFIVDMLVECLEDTEVLSSIETALEINYRKLSYSKLDVLTPLWMLSGHLKTAAGVIENRIDSTKLAPSSSIENAEGPCSSSANQDEISSQSTNTTDSTETDIDRTVGSRCSSSNTTPSSVDGPQPLSPSFTAFYRDVYVQVFLKPGCAHELDYATSFSHRNDMLTIHTFVGLSMLVEEGVTVSEISGARDTVSVHRENGTGYELDFTLVFPPGCSHCFSGVLSVEHRCEGTRWTKIETSIAVLFVGNGSHKIVATTSGGLTYVKNAYEVGNME